MKKIFTICLFLCPCVVRADVPSMNTKYTWSYGALADTMKAMRNNCEITSADEFVNVGNWFRDNNAFVSMNELKNKCQQSGFKTINREYTTKSGERKLCEMPYADKCDGKTCGEQNFVANNNGIHGCNIFISTLRKNNNERAQILKDRKPGTYVKKIVLADNELYKIYDVVLAPDYWVSSTGKVNSDSNQNPENTKIYEITSDNTIQDTGLYTWTNDMFFDVSATDRSTKGDVRGAFVNSYIWPRADLTKDIYDMYDERRGQILSTAQNTWDSRQEGDFDIKYKYSNKYAIDGQTSVESNTNGVMFNGKIAHLDWLGHALFGMNREESVGPDVLANWAANKLSTVGSRMEDVKKNPVKGVVAAAAGMTNLGLGVSVFEGVTESKPEPENMQQAWDMGAQLVRDNKEKRIMTFAEIQTKTEQEAYQRAKQEMKKIYPNAQGISCAGNCNRIPGTNDIVICTDSTNRRLEFVFDDICN